MQQHQPQDTSTMLYRIGELERQIHEIREQLKTYVPATVNDIQLQNIQSSLARMERDVVEMKTKQEKVEEEARKRYEQQENTISTLQIRFLIAVVTTVVTIIGSIVVSYVGHLFR